MPLKKGQLIICTTDKDQEFDRNEIYTIVKRVNYDYYSIINKWGHVVNRAIERAIKYGTFQLFEEQCDQYEEWED